MWKIQVMIQGIRINELFRMARLFSCQVKFQVQLKTVKYQSQDLTTFRTKKFRKFEVSGTVFGNNTDQYVPRINKSLI